MNGAQIQTEQLAWHYNGATIELGADWSGQGPLVLLLPALSSISTRFEMCPLQERLCANYRTVSIDWPVLAIDHARPTTGGLKPIWRIKFEIYT
jgi:hypothetical protein